MSMRLAVSLWLLALVLVEDAALAARAVLTWTAPTYNTNGSALTDLAGYMVHYRPKGSTVWRYRKVDNAGATTLTFWRLAPGTWQFRMRAYNVMGVRSVPTGIVEATLR